MRGPLAGFAATWPRKRTGYGWILALAGWTLLVPASFATAQSPPAGSVPHAAATTGGQSASTANSSRSKTTKAATAQHHATRRRHPARPKTSAASAVHAAPPPPVPPAQQPPNPAMIDFSNGLLSVRAQNSSLVEILNQVARQTGLVIDGLSHDARIYGQYGPGNISSTLSALLDGAGYNYVIVGGGTSHSPMRLILSTGGGGVATSSPGFVGTQDAPPATSEPTEPADPTMPVQPKTPQEIFNEMRSMHPQ
ncbi:MAG: hypothetical protein ACYCOR_06685 [Acidobacteriaceae bacterium]